MRTYRITIEPLSSFITPMQSDTLFGHLAWAVAMTESADVLTDILDRYRQGRPPFLLTEAFPEGLLPVPTLPPPNREEVAALAQRRHPNRDKASLRETVEAVKKARKVSFLPEAAMVKLVDGLSSLTLYEALMEEPGDPATCPKCFAFRPVGRRQDCGFSQSKEDITRTAVNRLTASGLQGQLFSHEETFFGPGSLLNIWLRADDSSWADRVHNWLRVVQEGGFGKRKSAGQGHFRLGKLEEASLPEADNANAFLTLSAYVPMDSESTDGCWRHVVKRGKLGGPWALEGDVWKKPLLMFAPGSVFRIQGQMASHYGGLVPGMHGEHKEVCQYAIAFPLGVRWEA